MGLNSEIHWKCSLINVGLCFFQRCTALLHASELMDGAYGVESGKRRQPGRRPQRTLCALQLKFENSANTRIYRCETLASQATAPAPLQESRIPDPGSYMNITRMGKREEKLHFFVLPPHSPRGCASCSFRSNTVDEKRKRLRVV